MQFQVLRCFSCQTFNTDIVKKDNRKWTCKICQEKQSVKKVYFVSDSAKDCRLAVQNLNEKRGQLEEASTVSDEDTANASEENFLTNVGTDSKILKIHGQKSRWEKYNLDEK